MEVIYNNKKVMGKIKNQQQIQLCLSMLIKFDVFMVIQTRNEYSLKRYCLSKY